MVTPIGRYQIPSPAEMADTLVRAMNFKKPSPEARKMAGEFPIDDEERAVLVELYRQVAAVKVRQAMLDVLVATVAAQEL